MQNLELIPKKEILLLFPREDLINQFKILVEEFNKSAKRKINLVNLKTKLDSQSTFELTDKIKVYYYRSDLMRTEKSENILDYKDIDNFGNWYLFLDEAHRGEKEKSIAQDIFTALSRNGFLFNFSATFTDQIDRITTVYNFNLEKFINAGYGKNIYLSQSYFDFNKNRQDDFSQLEKQKQVLKSLITFTLVKKSRKNKNYYHVPLLITLVNSVNTTDSDLLLFFKELDKIATGNINAQAFENAKNELKQEFSNNKKYVFENKENPEVLEFDYSLLENIQVQDVLSAVFNSKSYGKIEFLEGEKGKELVLKLESAEKPFALIKIGDTSRFKKEKLGIEYNLIETFETKKYFEHINEREEINILLGSRSFYEGWDSNRPNVINMINIGKGEAKKFVIQGIGRGVRIEPTKGLRKRLPYSDKNKNVLLETLFIYATDKNSVKAILEELDNQKSHAQEVNIGELFEKTERTFDLLIPKNKDTTLKDKLAKFSINAKTKRKFLTFLNNISPNVLLIKYGLTAKDIKEIKSDDFYQIVEDNVYTNMSLLLDRVVQHKNIIAKDVNKIDLLKDEIIHFKHIKVKNLTDQEIEDLKEKIQNVKT